MQNSLRQRPPPPSCLFSEIFKGITEFKIYKIDSDRDNLAKTCIVFLTCQLRM